MRRALAVAIDIVAIGLLGAVGFVVFTGGGVYQVGTVRVSLRSVDNPLLVLCILLIARYQLRRWAPLLGNPRWNPRDYDERSRQALARGAAALTTMSLRCAVAFLSSIIALGIVVKCTYAWTSPGFYSGDDVEVHEMTISALRGYGWPVWDLRSPFFPLLFVYPVQFVSARAGFDDVNQLVFAGRVSVALLSTFAIWIVWRTGRTFWSGPGWALLAAGIFAANKMQMAFGSSELPRPVATVFVLLAFWALRSPSAVNAAAAGTCLGIAGCFRFSELIFVAPAAAELIHRRRRWTAALVTVAAGFVFLLVIGLADTWYWQEPFYSLRHFVDYTLVRGESSRGYQHAFWYLFAVSHWTNLTVFALAVAGTHRRTVGAALWAWLPLLILSALPHKEARYLIPVVPFVSLLAVSGLRVVLSRIVDARLRRGWMAPALIAALVLAALHDIGHWRLRRTDQDVRLAAYLAAVHPARVYAIERAWRMGGRLYFPPGTAVIDLDPDALADPEYLWRSAPPDAWIALDAGTAATHGVAELLHGRTYREVPLPAASRYRLWTPVR